MVAKLRLFSALCALVAAVIVVWQANPAGVALSAERSQLRVHRRAADGRRRPRIKWPVVDTRRSPPVRPVRATSRSTSSSASGWPSPRPTPEDGLRCHYDAGNYQMAVEAFVWRTYEQTLPADAVELDIDGHRAAQYWIMKPTDWNNRWWITCMIAFKTSYGVIQQSLFYSPDLLRTRRGLPADQPAAGPRAGPVLHLLIGRLPPACVALEACAPPPTPRPVRNRVAAAPSCERSAGCCTCRHRPLASSSIADCGCRCATASNWSPTTTCPRPRPRRAPCWSAALRPRLPVRRAVRRRVCGARLPRAHPECAGHVRLGRRLRPVRQRGRRRRRHRRLAARPAVVHRHVRHRWDCPTWVSRSGRCWRIRRRR